MNTEREKIKPLTQVRRYSEWLDGDVRPFVASIGSILAAIVLFSTATLGLHFCATSSAWPSVEGEVKHTEESEYTNFIFFKQPSQWVHYEYCLERECYSSTRLNSAHHMNSNLSPKNRYRKGQSVVVYYDPSDPNKAILEKGCGSDVWSQFGMGAGFMLLGIMAMIRWRRR